MHEVMHLFAGHVLGEDLEVGGSGLIVVMVSLASWGLLSGWEL